MNWRLRGCPACGGDLYRDVEDLDSLTCLMCSRSFQAQSSRLESEYKGHGAEGAAQVDLCAERPWLKECVQAA